MKSDAGGTRYRRPPLPPKLRLPMADSIILATALAYDATLWTQDVDFEGFDGVRYVGK